MRKKTLNKTPAKITTCEEEVTLIGDYLSSSLRTELTVAFESHMQACPDCVAFLQTYRKTIEATRAFLRNRPALLGLSHLERRGHAIAAFTVWLHLFLSHMSLIAG